MLADELYDAAATSAKPSRLLPMWTWPIVAVGYTIAAGALCGLFFFTASRCVHWLTLAFPPATR